MRGAQILFYPTAIGWDPADEPEEQARQTDAWRTVQRAHAIANGLPLAACNRVGLEPDPGAPGQGQRFWGGSFACGPQGEVLAGAPAFEGDWAPRFDGRIMTAFERKGIAKGREIRDLAYRRKGRAAAPAADRP